MTFPLEHNFLFEGTLTIPDSDILHVFLVKREGFR